MDLKKIIGSVTKDKLLGGAANKILPMEEPSKISKKVKIAAVLAAFSALVGAVSQLIG